MPEPDAARQVVYVDESYHITRTTNQIARVISIPGPPPPRAPGAVRLLTVRANRRADGVGWTRAVLFDRELPGFVRVRWHRAIEAQR